MDFFEHQDKARRNTKWLVFYFVMAVLCIIPSVYLACLLISAGVSAILRSRRRESADGQAVCEFAFTGTCEQPFRELTFAAT